MRAATLAERAHPVSPGVRRFLLKLAPSHSLRDPALRDRLRWAGFEGDDPRVVYAAARVVLLVAVPTLTALVLVGRPMPYLSGAVVFALAAAWLVPTGVLSWMARRRQERVRRGIADALDLLVVCVDAGYSIEAASRFVARELLTEHRELASELDQTVRESRAGLARVEALRSLYARTGVAELRLVATSVIQSERWGTGLAEGLRTCAETLRTKRVLAAERRAWTAPIKMAVVLVSLILMPLLILVYELSAGG